MNPFLWLWNAMSNFRLDVGLTWNISGQIDNLHAFMVIGVCQPTAVAIFHQFVKNDWCAFMTFNKFKHLYFSRKMTRNKLSFFRVRIKVGRASPANLGQEVNQIWEILIYTGIEGNLGVFHAWGPFNFLTKLHLWLTHKLFKFAINFSFLWRIKIMVVMCPKMSI